MLPITVRDPLLPAEAIESLLPATFGNGNPLHPELEDVLANREPLTGRTRLRLAEDPATGGATPESCLRPRHGIEENRT